MSQIETLLSINFWQYLSISNLSNFCLVNRQVRENISKPFVWKTLLERDFLYKTSNKTCNKTYKSPRDKYVKIYKILKYWSPNIPIITQNAIKIIAKFIPGSAVLAGFSQENPEYMWNNFYVRFNNWAFKYAGEDSRILDSITIESVITEEKVYLDNTFDWHAYGVKEDLFYMQFPIKELRRRIKKNFNRATEQNLKDIKSICEMHVLSEQDLDVYKNHEECYYINGIPNILPESLEMLNTILYYVGDVPEIDLCERKLRKNMLSILKKKS